MISALWKARARSCPDGHCNTDVVPPGSAAHNSAAVQKSRRKKEVAPQRRMKLLLRLSAAQKYASGREPGLFLQIREDGRLIRCCSGPVLGRQQPSSAMIVTISLDGP